jgi:hypothetical protein
MGSCVCPCTMVVCTCHLRCSASICQSQKQAFSTTEMEMARAVQNSTGQDSIAFAIPAPRSTHIVSALPDAIENTLTIRLLRNELQRSVSLFIRSRLHLLNLEQSSFHSLAFEFTTSTYD